MLVSLPRLTSLREVSAERCSMHTWKKDDEEMPPILSEDDEAILDEIWDAMPRRGA